VRIPGKFPDRVALAQWLRQAQRRAHWRDWRWQLRQSLDAVDLARLGLLPDLRAMQAAIQYPVRVTPYFLTLSDLSGAADGPDPIRRQWQPAAGEMAAAVGVGGDPFDEAGHMAVRGVVHRFPDRVLVMVSSACAVICRHCTRKNSLPDSPVVRTAQDLRHAVAYVRANPGIREVILSGGDPLLLADAQVLRLVRAFAALDQIDAVRIGTRAPVTLPMRITPALARGLGGSRKVWVNTQFNHVRELTPAAAAACGRLVDAGIPVSNQTVLLKGVNDTADDLVKLCAGLQRIRVRPYYVFVCDPVSGTSHFHTTQALARELASALAGRLGGLAVPRFVADVAGAHAKVPVEALE
jgi:lysine 2,3-aminomutase